MTEEELKVFSMLKNVEVVFDVGARTDLDYWNIRQCEYHIFEPCLKFFKVLEEKAKKIGTDKIFLNQVGVSDMTANDCVYYTDTQSFLKNPLYYNADFGERYKTITLDDYIVKKKIERIDFIKLDAEGMDYRILTGSPHAVEMASYIQFEYWEGCRKFNYPLKGFDLYLIMEPELRKFVKKFSDDKKYDELLVPYDEDVYEMTDELLHIDGAGGNVLAVKKGKWS